jgi:two-component system response regulator HydG
MDAADRSGPARLCLAFGGPITAPEDLDEVFRHSRVHGFAGGSVFERLPVQNALASTIRGFKSVAVHRGGESGPEGLGEMIGRSSAIRAVFDLIRRTAPYDVNVCIEGESGTGKELVATLLHRMSNRANQPFVTLNCGAIPDTLLESELFGHEKGAFTGADRRRLGKFELAHGGTLFLDEIADLSPRGQVAILRALQQREITRVGGETSIPVDVRVLAASNQVLSQAVAEGRFRADLYYRLNYLTIQLPPLRDRRDDLPQLIGDTLARLRVRLNRRLEGISPAFQRKLEQHGWPGNVRELQHVLGQAALREDGTELDGRFFVPTPAVPGIAPARNAPVVHVKRNAVARNALREAGGNKSRAAKSLGITRKTLYVWLADAT